MIFILLLSQLQFGASNCIQFYYRAKQESYFAAAVLSQKGLRCASHENFMWAIMSFYKNNCESAREKPQIKCFDTNSKAVN